VKYAAMRPYEASITFLWTVDHVTQGGSHIWSRGCQPALHHPAYQLPPDEKIHLARSTRVSLLVLTKTSWESGRQWVGFDRVNVSQTYARLVNGWWSLPMTLPTGLISNPCPNVTGHPTQAGTHRVCKLQL
jgi:hypothetical protein